MKPPRPVYLNLFAIRQPLPALVSVGHRISGAVLFLGIPILLWAFHALLTGNSGEFAHGAFRLALFLVLAAYVFHFFAGLRFLLLDMHWGVARNSARRAALGVALAAGLSIVLLGIWLW